MVFFSHVLHADPASTDQVPPRSRLERLTDWRPELVVQFDRRQPKTEFVRKEMAAASRAVALDERRRAEVLQTTSGTRQRLAASLCARCGVL